LRCPKSQRRFGNHCSGVDHLARAIEDDRAINSRGCRNNAPIVPIA
jgi:hypothetical protein